MSLIVGLTGGIGSGKSAAAEMFRERGAAIIDTDEISHRLTGPGGAAMPAIAAAFGPEYVQASGALDRTRMRAAVFSDPGAKTRLEAILHPMIAAEVEADLARHAHAPYRVVVVPLLFEAGSYAHRVDRVAAVDCDEAQQVARTMSRSGLTEAEVRSIMARQLSRQERVRRSDDVICNAGDLADLRRRVDQLDAEYRQLSKNWPPATRSS